MPLPEYLADVAKQLRLQSTSIRREFSSHKLSAGENREDLVRDFLKAHLPKRFGINTGFTISHDGQISNQTDLIVADELNNSPLYGARSNQLWPVEAVYAVIEVKTSLSPQDINDSVAKCQKFKTQPRKLFENGVNQISKDSLFVVWAFDCPSLPVLKKNIVDALGKIPREQQPDLFIVPDKFVGRSGRYLEISRLGEVNSSYRADLLKKFNGNISHLMPEPIEIDDYAENSLLAWYIWFDSWLRRVGHRLYDPLAYVPVDDILGNRI